VSLCLCGEAVQWQLQSSPFFKPSCLRGGAVQVLLLVAIDGLAGIALAR
jgi:hypothetical protein